jgi:uncharacterized protein (TIGR04255 family)
MLITIGSTTPESPDMLSIILDLDYIMTDPETIRMEAAPEWIEQAHSAIERAFEYCITNRTRILFEEVQLC